MPDRYRDGSPRMSCVEGLGTPLLSVRLFKIREVFHASDLREHSVVVAELHL